MEKRKDEQTVEEIVATVEGPTMEQIEARLMAAEREIAELRASASRSEAQGRKTAGVAELMAKQGAEQGNGLSALDAALSSLPVEQRMTVKSQLLRAGLLAR